MIAPTPFFADRGCHVRIYEEAVALEKLGHRVTIVTYHIGNTPKNLRVERIPPLVFWYKKLEAGPAWSKFLLDGLLFLKTLSLIVKNNYDLVHGHLHEGALIGKMASLLAFKKLPVIFDYQGSLTGEILAHHFLQENKGLFGIFKAAERGIDQTADYIICSSSPGLTDLTEHFKIDGNKLKFIRDGIGSKSNGLDRKEVERLKKKFKIPQSKSIVVYLGILSKYQGVDILLDSIKTISEKRNDIHFLIMGYPNVDLYMNKAREMGIENFVTFTGKTPYLQIYDFLGMGDIAVSPKLSKTEANGKLYNYMAAGLPTVVFESKINREIVGEFGIYAKYGDYKDLAKKILWTIDNKKDAKKLSEGGKKQAIGKYSWAKSIRNIENIYYDLLK